MSNNQIRKTHHNKLKIKIESEVFQMLCLIRGLKNYLYLIIKHVKGEKICNIIDINHCEKYHNNMFMK